MDDESSIRSMAVASLARVLTKEPRLTSDRSWHRAYIRGYVDRATLCQPTTDTESDEGYQRGVEAATRDFGPDV